MEDIKRRLNIQTLKSQLLLNDLERSALRRELASPLISVERRNAIHARIPILIRQRMRTESKLEWFEAVERLHPAGHYWGRAVTGSRVGAYWKTAQE